jgi:DNA-binding Xre family transcriptional regulator
MRLRGRLTLIVVPRWSSLWTVGRLPAEYSGSMADVQDQPTGDPHNVIAFPGVATGAGDAEPPSIREAIGDVLRTERHDQERTLEEVAREAGVSLPYLSEVERGVKDVSSEVLESIGRSLELPPADVLERAAERLRGRVQRPDNIRMLAA